MDQKKLRGRAWVFGDNVDTDLIYHNKYLAETDPKKMPQFAFEYYPGKEKFAKEVKPGDFVVAGRNFGCGSSREHAPWALGDYGFKVILAESFADIFFNNCFKSGILPLVLPKAEIDALFALTEYSPGFKLTVDLAQQQVVRPDGHVIPFQVDPFRKECLLNGWDDIGLTLRHADKIREFEDRRKQQLPWLFA